MSKTVDERVVEMRFDNKQFESNVQTSLSTIGKLKQSLDLRGASKGLENVSAAAKTCNLSGLTGAVETVQAKFSALEVMAVTALANITNSAVNAGKRLISALTIEPVRSGFEEYETQINAIQTILANTESKGSTLQDINQALDELNHYADLTIYNFTEMTRNIGTFTAAGVDLETSVSAIKGIANLAAVSGSTSQQASTAMYQLSQALAAGTVKLQDWNSVVNAGMGGQVFQDALKETARVHGIAIDQMITDEGSFRETLSKGWLTAEVLTETLSKFTGDLTEASKAARSSLDINSPSKVFYKIGGFAGQGFVNALVDYSEASYDAGSNIGLSAREGLSRAIYKATEIVSNGIDNVPTIRPVLDLSAVRAGANEIGGILGMDHAIGLSGNLGAITTMMAQNQNGNSSDVVDAINRLGKKLNNLGNTYNNIGGVTYDDTSGVSDAIEILTRAVVVEGRR